MRRIPAALLAIVLVFAATAVTLAQELERRPVEDQLFGVSSVVPADWQDLGSGTYARGTPPQDLKWHGQKTELIIGDDNVFREFVTVNIGTASGTGATRIGNRSFLMMFSHVAHDCVIEDDVILTNAVLLGGQTLEIHRIERDEQMIARLIELERQFWHYVESDTPPPADGTASAEAALRCLYPEDSGQTVDLSQHAGLTAAYIELKAVRQSIADKEKREAELKQMLQQAMGDASRAEFSNGYVSWRKAKDSVGLDVAQLLKDKPYLQAKYPLLKTGARRFLVG